MKKVIMFFAVAVFALGVNAQSSTTAKPADKNAKPATTKPATKPAAKSTTAKPAAKSTTKTAPATK